MSITEEYAAFLDSIHLFQGISEDHLFDIAERLETIEIDEGTEIFAENVPAEDFYLVFSGEIEVSNAEDGQKTAIFRHRDFLGEEALLAQEKRQTSVKAKSNAVLLKLSKEYFVEIPGALSFLQEKLSVSVKCKKLSKELHFDWVEKDERIHFVVRKHPIVFWKGFVLSVFLGVFGLVSGVWGMWVGSIFGLLGSAGGILAFFILGIWYWVDWRNDYYIVTNKRVVWLEKVVGIHESRQDSYMHEILSVGSDADFLGDMLGYATLSVKTKVGSMDMHYAPHARQARALVEELWHHATEREERKKEEELYLAIADRIKKSEIVDAPVKERKTSGKVITPKKESVFFRNNAKQKKKRHLLDLRYQEGKEIIYRKHWVMLLKRAFLPLSLTLFLFGYALFELYLIIFVRSQAAMAISFTVLLILGGIASLGWLIYQYMDWSDDIFKVTPNKIFDIDRKPLGDVQSRSAPLENIESTEYKRSGLISIIFNYGTVYIHIGAEEFEFENVFDPASVQQDINRRHMAHMKKKKAADGRAERDQMLEWMVAYHHGEDKFRKMLDELKTAEGRDGVEYGVEGDDGEDYDNEIEAEG
ncbi:MAG: cyclic nucleotide-binding domain-containing protein [Chloroflexi bacterium]|nr:cyclic nucleotide-binding domain-containing protein [Chloroflexota bacterium]